MPALGAPVILFLFLHLKLLFTQRLLALPHDGQAPSVEAAWPVRPDSVVKAGESGSGKWDPTAESREKEPHLVTPDRASSVDPALLSHLLKIPRLLLCLFCFVLFCLSCYGKSLIPSVEDQPWTPILFFSLPSGQSMSHWGPPPCQAAPGLHVLSVTCCAKEFPWMFIFSPWEGKK